MNTRVTRGAARALWCPTILVVTQLLGGPAEAQVATPDFSRELTTARQVLGTDQVQRALKYIERLQAHPDDLVQEWLGICNAYGPWEDEIFRSRHIYKLFRIYGLERVHIDEEMNVIGVRPGVGDGPTLVLNAHHDAVALWPKEQPIEAFVADGRVWCPAAGDDLAGVVQILHILKALNAANIQTAGDLWFATFTGEERGSRGARHFTKEHYPHHLDWRRGDAIVQLHNGGGGGATTGSDPLYHYTQLRLFTPFQLGDLADRPRGDFRFMRNVVDVLGRVITRVRDEVWDPRSEQISFRLPGQQYNPPMVFLNMARLSAMPIMNAPGSEASVEFDLRSKSKTHLDQAHAKIRQIAEEECAKAPRYLQPCGFVYQINVIDGTQEPIQGWDKANNAPARMIMAAAQALYGGQPVIDSTQGCGDCIGSYMEGMPAMSLRGGITDYGNGRVEREGGERLQSETRRRSTGHDVTQSAEINGVWSGIKHGVLFAVSYVGLRP